MTMSSKIEKTSGTPEHIAIIMDGNGRWASRRGNPRVFGHNAGMKALKEIVKACPDLGVGFLTVYAFSTENWKRPQDEVQGIFRLMVKYIESELAELHKNNVKVGVIGDWSAIPAEAGVKLQDALKTTKDNTGLVFTIALNYGGRRELTEAFRKLAAERLADGVTPEALESIDEEAVSAYLNTAGLPDPDLIIRTGGEQRLSNFLLWQCAYSEFIFTDVLWPDFGREELENCIEEFRRRHRRYGGL